jgi:putative spermidine/putrescine transport system permease protein
MRKNEWVGPVVLRLPAGILVLICVVIPMAYLFRVSLADTGAGFGAVSGFTFGNYLQVLTDSYYVTILLQTLWVSVLVTALTLILGFPLGYSLARSRGRSKVWLLGIVLLPLVLSLVVNVFGWIVILGRDGFVNSALIAVGLIETPLNLLYNTTAVVIVLTQICLPFQILSSLSIVSNIDPVLEEAAANLRAPRHKVFLSVIIPLSLPGMVAGSVLSFMLAVTAIVAPQLIGGTRTKMVGSVLYEQMIIILNWPLGAALSFLFLFIALLTLALSNLALKRRRLLG